MTGELKAFLFVLAINFLVAILYLIINLFRKQEKRKSFLIRFFVMLLCPVVGPLFFFVSFIIFKLFMSEPVDLEDVVFSKERVKSFVRPDEARESNIVSLEEAVEIMDKDNLRETMMSVVRGDIRQSLSTISLALNSEDSETSHYAASVLVDALNEFRGNVASKLNMVLEDKEDSPEIAVMLLGYMNKVLVQKVFTDIEQKDFVEKMDETGEYLFSYKKELLTPALYEDLSLRHLEVEDYENCKKWCERAAYEYPDVLSTYTCQLKLYFANGERERFFSVMSDLKNSDLVIDKETLEMIRIFM